MRSRSGVPGHPAKDSAVECAIAAAAIWNDSGPAAITFGAVAERAGFAKSLVSHHFTTRGDLVCKAADLVVGQIENGLQRFATAAAGLEPDLVTPAEEAAYLIEHLVAVSPSPGVALLELASLGLDAPPYREQFRRTTTAIEALLPPDEAAILLPFVLGELLGCCPQQRGAVSLMGLRQRLGWLMGSGSGTDATNLSQLLSMLRGSETDLPALESLGGAPGRTGETLPQREAIVTAALDILSENGSAAVTHRKIAERAGVPLAATTYHFASKLDIIEAVYLQIIDSALENRRRLAGGDRAADLPSWAAMIRKMLDYYFTAGRRRTLAHFHLALSACRTASLSNFAARARANEVELLRESARDHGVMLGRNAAQTVVSLIGGILLLRLLGAPTLGRAG